MTRSLPDANAELAERVGALSWYHTLELAPGVVTPGWFDTRPSLRRVPLPTTLRGRRCLDIGTWDGFWAFEMERRGAAAVTAIDIDDPARWDWPPHLRSSGTRDGQQFVDEFKSRAAAFWLAHAVLGSSVERLDLSVYDLSPEAVGQYDFVFMGSLLLHLRDPVGALDRVRTVCAGEAVFADAVEAVPSLARPRTPMAGFDGLDHPWWWTPNVAGLHRMIRSAGFQIIERSGLYGVRTGPAHPRTPLRDVPRLLSSSAGREKAIAALWGVPHAAVRARPAS